MPARVAVLSDIHGVLPLLDAVLGEPDVASADLIVVTGDHATGPQPAAVLDRLQQLGDRAILVRGNADRELIELGDGSYGDAEPAAVDRWAAQQLSPTHRQLLAEMPQQLTVTIDGLGDVLFCHATPRDDQEIVLVDTRLSRWSEVFADMPPEVRVVVCGHTHMPFIRLVDRRWVVNAGSVGMPYGTTDVPWVLLSRGALSLRSTPG